MSACLRTESFSTCPSVHQPTRLAEVQDCVGPIVRISVAAMQGGDPQSPLEGSARFSSRQTSLETRQRRRKGAHGVLSFVLQMYCVLLE